MAKQANLEIKWLPLSCVHKNEGQIPGLPRNPRQWSKGDVQPLIAAEQTGRKCYMMELDPHYCDIIIARWEKLTGKEAVKVERNAN